MYITINYTAFLNETVWTLVRTNLVYRQYVLKTQPLAVWPTTFRKKFATATVEVEKHLVFNFSQSTRRDTQSKIENEI